MITTALKDKSAFYNSLTDKGVVWGENIFNSGNAYNCPTPSKKQLGMEGRDKER